MATAVTPRPDALQRDRGAPAWRQVAGRLPQGRLARFGLLLAWLVVIAGVVGRFLAPSGLWLDEALSVDIAKLPLQQVPGALVQDGSPPLYYLILHYWMVVFGQSDFAVRALSGVISTATLPFLWAAGERAGGRRAAWAALLLGASSPWAIYYATDTRMYSLMALEAILWYLAARRALELPSRGRLACVAAVTAALMYTHYWDLYLVAAGGLWALWRSWTENRTGATVPYAQPGAARKLLWAMVVGGVIFLPWSPVFLFQAMHTGTPWTAPPGPEDLLSVFGYFAGTVPGTSASPWTELLTFVLFGFVALGLFAKPGPNGTSVVMEVRAQPRARFVALLVAGPLAIAVLAGMLTGAAFDNRYIAVVFPLFIVLCALGLSVFSSRRVSAAMLAVACTAGLFAAQAQNSQPRTQAVQVAADLNAQARPGDVVVYCPDQLGPAVYRLFDVPGVTQLTYPRMIGPARVDWVDYLWTIQHTVVSTFAREVWDRVSPGGTLWLVWRNGYQGFGNSCGNLASWLQMLSPGGQTLITEDTS
ncbi:MAG TPA: glycosyltransferase family 39 protein, partial [Acidimicrobiales bacterium]|nr:glycosyltransferase family 39 protein [Acidimicrobiales bacterium]